jgi:hypothetical protein
VVNVTGPPRRRAGHRAVVVETRGVGLGVAMVDRAAWSMTPAEGGSYRSRRAPGSPG